MPQHPLHSRRPLNDLLPVVVGLVDEPLTVEVLSPPVQWQSGICRVCRSNDLERFGLGRSCTVGSRSELARRRAIYMSVGCVCGAVSVSIYPHGMQGILIHL